MHKRELNFIYIDIPSPTASRLEEYRFTLFLIINLQKQLIILTKMNRTILLSLVLALLMISCQPYSNFYQVYEVASQDVNKFGDVLLSENEDCRVTYNLWAENGNVSFLFSNKTDSNLYVVMPKSFFILNGIANDYYTQSVYGMSVTNAKTATASTGVGIRGYLTNGTLWYPSYLSRQYQYSYEVSSTQSVNTPEMAMICVPSHSSRYIKGFNISDYVYKDCERRNENYPPKSSSLLKFSQENSPLTFRNLIAYSFYDDSSSVKYLDHSFYISSLQNYSETAILIEETSRECESQIQIHKKVFTVFAPNKFYNIYSGTPTTSTTKSGNVISARKEKK